MNFFFGGGGGGGGRGGTIADVSEFLRIFLKSCLLFLIQSNPVDKDTEGAIESVRFKGVSILSGLNLEKM